MMAKETPSAVMYALLKTLKISNKEAASILLSDNISMGGQTPRERINERTYMSRIAHAEPGELPRSYFADFNLSAQTLTSRILKNKNNPITVEDLLAFLKDEAAPQMKESCAAFGLDAALFNNVIEKTYNAEDLSDIDKASMLMLALITTGCIGDTAFTAEEVERFSKSIASRGFRTDIADVDEFELREEPQEVKLGLVRVIDGALDLNNIHTLNTGEEGTTIGSLSTDKFSINDVGPLVSKKHLKVYRDESGAWYAVGLDSTNGTTLIKGSDKAEVVIEEPRAQRKSASKPVEIKAGDALHLAGTTVFLTMLVH